MHISTPFCQCSLRKLEAERLGKYFVFNGCELVDSPESSDYHILISCAVTKANIDNHLQYIKNVEQNKSELIVMGCLPGTNPKELIRVFSGKTVVTKDICDIDAIFPDFRIAFNEVPQVYSYDIGAFHMFTEDVATY
ncbi:MAG TPA: hypothetical protein PLM49_08075, partial [Bacteroidales bacterium]|nr:hypothetical protein [Bacteroidales bacterium]